MPYGRYLFGNLEPTRPIHGFAEDGLMECYGMAPVRGAWMPAGNRGENMASQEELLPSHGFAGRPFNMVSGAAAGIYIPFFSSAPNAEVWRFDPDTLVAADATNSGGDYSFAEDEFDINFCAYGEKVVIAMGGDEPVQVYDTGTSRFTDLITSTTKPQGRYPFTVGSHLFIARMDSPSDDANQYKYWWSATGDADNFEPDSNNAGFAYLLASNGRITGAVGREDYGLIFQEFAVTRIQRGASTYWEQFTIARGDLGCLGHETIEVGPDGATYYRSRNGFARVDPSGNEAELLVPSGNVLASGIGGLTSGPWKGVHEDVPYGERGYGFSVRGFVGWRQANQIVFGSSPYGHAVLLNTDENRWTTLHTGEGNVLVPLPGIRLDTTRNYEYSYPLQDIAYLVKTAATPEFELRSDRDWQNYYGSEGRLRTHIWSEQSGQPVLLRQLRLIHAYAGKEETLGKYDSASAQQYRFQDEPPTLTLTLKVYGANTEEGIFANEIASFDVNDDMDDSGFKQLQGKAAYRMYAFLLDVSEHTMTSFLETVGVEFEYEIEAQRR